MSKVRVYSQAIYTFQIHALIYRYFLKWTVLRNSYSPAHYTRTSSFHLNQHFPSPFANIVIIDTSEATLKITYRWLWRTITATTIADTMHDNHDPDNHWHGDGDCWEYNRCDATPVSSVRSTVCLPVSDHYNHQTLTVVVSLFLWSYSKQISERCTVSYRHVQFNIYELPIEYSGSDTQ